MTKYEKEVWIRFSDIEAYSEHREKLFELLGKAYGECKTKIFLQSEGKVSSLYSDYSFDDERLSLLTDVYGAENVKIVTKPVRARSQRDIIECCGNCIERIADALERIACALDGEKPNRRE